MHTSLPDHSYSSCLNLKRVCRGIWVDATFRLTEVCPCYMTYLLSLPFTSTYLHLVSRDEWPDPRYGIQEFFRIKCAMGKMAVCGYSSTWLSDSFCFRSNFDLYLGFLTFVLLLNQGLKPVVRLSVVEPSLEVPEWISSSYYISTTTWLSHTRHNIQINTQLNRFLRQLKMCFCPEENNVPRVSVCNEMLYIPCLQIGTNCPMSKQDPNHVKK
jgi:hypothetical protein